MQTKRVPESLFPHENVRPVQSELIKTVERALDTKSSIVVHAPTGLGKTAATLAPCLKRAFEKDVHVLFLTSRHTQHKIVLETLQLMKKKYDMQILGTSIIGKKHLCAQQNVAELRTSDFHSYCKALREDKKCVYYENVREKNNVVVPQTMGALEQTSPNSTEEVFEQACNAQLCPYELSLLMAAKAKIIVSDYYYMLHPTIRASFLNKVNKKMENAIIVVDEAHNLPSRARALLSHRLTSSALRAAMNEAEKNDFDDIIPFLSQIQDAVYELTKSMSAGAEKKLTKDALLSLIDEDVESQVDLLESRADEIREQKKQSAIGNVARFLVHWPGPNDGFARYATRDDNAASLVYRCLDPGLVTQEMIEGSYSTIFMSGTMVPTKMYKDILGLPAESVEEVFPSPFPEKNRLALIVPKTTTKFTARSPAQYEAIASVCADVINNTPGHGMIFFPSYKLRNDVSDFLLSKSKKTILMEQPGLTKQEKEDLLQRFTSYKEAVLLGVAAGSFGEGVDLPGVLKSVVVVGLPLERPTIETKELITYYDNRFGKGWDYGYVLPAIAKCLQNAGRCIRSETDRGVIVFLDERYPRYRNCIPNDWNVVTTFNYMNNITEFFKE